MRSPRAERERRGLARHIATAPVLLAMALGAGCATTPAEPRNLGLHKEEIRSYVREGGYEADLAKVCAQAERWLDKRAVTRQEGEKLLVIFDIDETLLSNLAYSERHDFGFDKPSWDRWVREETAKPIGPTRELFLTAKALGYSIVLLTGREEPQRDATARNLAAAGITGYAELICKPTTHKGTSESYKTAHRQRLTEAGWTIVASIGDQQSDLDGGYVERTFKLPGPFYLVR